MPLTLRFLWHMHQPDYRDASGRMGMPWVFLHAIKDYYEMPWLLSRHEGLKATFNLTPPLIEQLRLYEARGAEADRFLSLWSREPGALSDPEREEVARICTSARFETMVKPIPRFAELYGKKGLDDAEFRDLELCFLLSWCGNYLRRENETVRDLLAKGREFTEEDKTALLESLLAFLPTILPWYRKLWEEGRIALSTTPLNHPILPLLMDMENARRSNPSTQLPSNHFPLKEDAREQVRRALALFRDVFGRPPRGFWPAEGAVDSSSVFLYREEGLEWIATDEAILFASLGSDDRAALYRDWSHGGVRIAFRDHPLSDKIGFTYRHWEPERAAADFLEGLETIGRRYPDASVAVILDGENAWEFYPENAMPFFEALYDGLGARGSIRTETMERAPERPETLPTLHPGSWIYGTFDTWVGHPEKNAAWELIYQTRRDYMHHEAQLPPGQREYCLEQFLAAECSDWFWWYGEDHYTEFGSEFDALFRSRLIAVYRAMEQRPPANLLRPIVERGESRALMVEPKFPVTPRIDGRVDSFFEWLGSGMSDERRLFSTMDGAERGPVERLYWGLDAKALYLRLDGDLEKLKEGGRLEIFAGSRHWSLSLEDPAKAPRGIRWALDEILEIAIDRTLLPHDPAFTLRLEIVHDDKLLQILPGAGELHIDPAETLERCWFV